MTKEELIALGYPEDVATALVKASGTQSSASLPFPVLKLNYDLKDILSDKGVKKGAFITGWEVDNKNLTIKKEGKILKQPLEFIVLASVYQSSNFNNSLNKVDVITNIFFSAYDARKITDKKSGKTIGQLKEEGKKVTFNNLLLMLVKEGKEWNPYIFYSHGTHYAYWGESLANAGVAEEDKVLNTTYKVKSKKVPTNFNPAWVFDLVKAETISMEERIALIKTISPVIKKFNDFVEEYNSGDEAPVAGAAAVPSAPSTPEIEDDDEDDICF